MTTAEIVRVVNPRNGIPGIISIKRARKLVNSGRADYSRNLTEIRLREPDPPTQGGWYKGYSAGFAVMKLDLTEVQR